NCHTCPLPDIHGWLLLPGTVGLNTSAPPQMSNQVHPWQYDSRHRTMLDSLPPLWNLRTHEVLVSRHLLSGCIVSPLYQSPSQHHPQLNRFVYAILHFLPVFSGIKKSTP